MSKDPWDQLPQSPNCVTIFGAGIAGLTAAHELTERGFRVQIWEPAEDQRKPQRGLEVGGMARTQWSRTHWPDLRELDHFEPCVPATSPDPKHEPFGTPTQKILHFPQKIGINRKPPSKELLSLRDPIHIDKPLPVPPATWDWSGVELSVRHWEAKNFEERKAFAELASEVIAEAFGVKVSSPAYFDRAVQYWKAGIKVKSKPTRERTILFKGEFPTKYEDGQRVPADAFGVLSFWQDSDGSQKSAIRFRGLGTLILYQEWTPAQFRALGAWGSRKVNEVLEEVGEALRANPEIKHLYLEVSDVDFADLSDEEHKSRAKVVAGTLQGVLPSYVKIVVPDTPPQDQTRRFLVYLDITGDAGKSKEGKQGPDEWRITLEIVPLAVYPTKTPPYSQILMSFRVRERWLPGEHGYRFFPSFYRHIFDTMKRTPILELVEKSEFSLQQEYVVNVDTPEPVRYVESPFTVFDNIHPTASHVLAFSNGQRPVALSRSAPSSFNELGEYIKVLFGSVENGGFAISPRESTRYALKLFKYMTSCEERRVDYEKESWWDFVEGDSYSQGIQDLLRKWPEALVAMNSKVADARSHGNAVVQLILDNISQRGYRDGTLRGPTSEAWFKHWRRYLEAQGVEFIHGKLTGFTVANERIVPKVECYEPRFPREPSSVRNKLGAPLLMPGYFVLAVAADQAVKLCQELTETSEYQNLQRPPYERSAFAHVAEINTNGLSRPEPYGDFRHFAGIQFYFAEDVFWVDAHVYYPDSPWGLTSISQVRFWADFTDWEHGFRGIISAIVAIWDQPGIYTTTKTAWECNEQEFAREVWAQIKNSVSGNSDGDTDGGSRYVVGSRARSGEVPDPLYWHIDDFLRFNPEVKHWENSTPFHIASPSGWPARPGDPKLGYDVEYGWVVCGMLAKTFTRIPTMEAANESARHAVNAILKQFDRCQPGKRPRLRGTSCDIFNPEDSEVEDFKWFKELDQKLVKRGLPHIVDILGLDHLTDSLLRGGEDDPLDPVNVMRQVGRLFFKLPEYLRKW